MEFRSQPSNFRRENSRTFVHRCLRFRLFLFMMGHVCLCLFSGLRRMFAQMFAGRRVRICLFMFMFASWFGEHQTLRCLTTLAVTNVMTRATMDWLASRPARQSSLVFQLKANSACRERALCSRVEISVWKIRRDQAKPCMV